MTTTVGDLISHLEDMISNGDISDHTLVMSRGSTAKMLEDELTVKTTRTKTGRNAVYIGPANTVATPTPTQPESTIAMSSVNSSTPFQTVTYVYGQDVKNLSAAQLIDAVKRIKAEIKALDDVGVTSAKIDAMKADLTATLNSVVAALDAVDAK